MNILTRHNVAEANCCHGDETKIECVEESDVFVVADEVGSETEE